MPKKDDQSQPKEISLEFEYQTLIGLANDFKSEIERQIHHLLIGSNVVLGFPIQSRVKNWQSVSEKLERNKLGLKSLRDLQDLIGIRLILLFKRDVDIVCEIIKQNFNVVRYYDTRDRLDDDKFGYLSIHYIVKLPEIWLTIPTMKGMQDFKAEIQVRTISQHIWASASHTLQYKQESNVPPVVRRSISRVSALLEIIDLELERVLIERDSYRADIDISEADELLNVDLLESILGEMLPMANKDDNEPYADLIENLQSVDIVNRNQLEEFIKRNLDKAIIEEELRVVKSQIELEEKGKVYGTSIERTKRGVFFIHVGLVRTMIENEFGIQFTSSGKRRHKHE